MINVVVLQGRFTDTPELRTIPNGTAVTTFTLAVSRSYVKAGEDRKTDFIDFVAWHKTAEFITKNFAKGQTIGITGHLQTDTYTDREGKSRKRVEVYVDRVDFLEKPAQSPTDIAFGEYVDEITRKIAEPDPETGDVGDLPF